MSISGLGTSLSSLSSQYNFRSMTNQQFFDTIQKLGKEGKLSKNDTDQLSFIAQGVDSVPITGASPSVTQILGDPTQHDFLSELQGDDYSANTQGAVAGAFYDEMLKSIQKLQSKKPDGVDPFITQRSSDQI